MNIYLIRHAEAEKLNPGLKDRQRALTQQGIEELKSSLILMHNYVSKIDIIFTSPYLRAVQTAEIIAESFKVKEKTVADKSVSPGFDSESLIELTAGYTFKEAAFVGHQPDIGDILSELISDCYPNFEIKPSTIIKIAFDRNPVKGKGILKFIFPPPVKNG
ncbi:MAG: histidine phosphatase family protein [Ignavibacteriaceae bacterium]